MDILHVKYIYFWRSGFILIPQGNLKLLDVTMFLIRHDLLFRQENLCSFDFLNILMIMKNLIIISHLICKLKTELFADPFAYSHCTWLHTIIATFIKSKEQKCLKYEFMKTLHIRLQNYLPWSENSCKSKISSLNMSIRLLR